MDRFSLVKSMREAEEGWQAGRQISLMGEGVVGSEAARLLRVTLGDHVISSPESVFDLAGVYPLKMRVAGVLDRSFPFPIH